MTKKQLRRAIIKYQNQDRCEQIRRTPHRGSGVNKYDARRIVEGQANAE